MVSSKQTKLVGLCRQCENELFGTGHRDFLGIAVEGLSFPVFCYSCGQIRVNTAGECVTKCVHQHNWSLLDRLVRFFNPHYTPNRLSE
jgi:hypothetical protein